MADTLERIYKLTVDGAEAVRQLQNVAKSTSGLEDGFKKATSAVKTFAKGAIVGFIANEIVGNMRAVIDSMDDVSKASQKLGIGVKALQEWQFALKLSGVDAGTFSTAVGKLSQGIADIGTGEINKVTTGLKTFGVTAKDTAESAMAKLAAAFSKMSDGPQKTALALEIFGKTGKELIPLLNSSARGINELAAEFHELHGAFSDEDVKRAEQFNDNMDKVALAASAGGRAIASTILPALVNFSNQLVENIKQLGFWQGAALTAWQVASLQIGTAEQRLQERLEERERVQSKTFGGFNVLAQLNLASIDKQIVALRAQVALEAEQAADRAKFARQAARFADEQTAADRKKQEALDAAKKAADDAAKAEAEARKVQQKNVKVNQQQMEVEGNKAIEKSIKELDDAREDSLEAYAKEQQARNEAAVTSVDYAQALTKLDEEQKAYTKSLEDAVLVEQQLQEWLVSGTEAQKEFAQAQFAARRHTDDTTKSYEKQVTVLSILDDGAKAFFENLGHGAASAADLFHRAVESIVANLLKLLAQKYILDALSMYFSAGNPSGPNFVGPPAAMSAAVPQPSGGASRGSRGRGAMPTAAGVAPPVSFPSSGLMPLPLPQSGQAQGPQVQVNVHNKTSADVNVQTSEDGARIDIIVERTRRALASDMRSGGNLFSSALESTYSLGRARG